MSLKARLRVLLIVSSILPLTLIWIFTSYRVYGLYRQNTDMLIKNELTQIKSNMDILMDSLKYMSQQLVNDENTTRKLRDHFHIQDDVQRVNNLKFLREQIAVYEVSNPNINNITYFYIKDGAVEKINITSLVRPEFPPLSALLSSQNQITFYGPHDTLSVVAKYPVISLIRKITIPDVPDLYLYIESGYKQMGAFAAQTLDRLGAVYTVVSDNGKVIYSSDEKILACQVSVPAGDNKVKIHGEQFLPYRMFSAQDWSLQVFVPYGAYKQYLDELSLGFILAAILATMLSLAIAGLIWNSINRPFRLFEENLNNILTDDIDAHVQRIYVKEFDQNFEYFEKLRLRILALIQAAQQQEQEKSQLQIKQLLTKINPHFIHNTLDTLKWYSLKQGYPDVESFVSSLNRLLMYNMEKDKQTTLESELAAIDDYIALQKLKYDINYYTVVNIPAPMLQTEIPRFILQPLVENAIFHGLEGNGSICIKINVLPNGKISIQVINDGNLLDIGKINSILMSAKDLSSNGIGIQYVMRMLQNKFPDAYEFRVRTQNNMNCIEIVIPFSKGGYYAKSVNC
jgi:sensor histidine kinase YesM